MTRRKMSRNQINKQIAELRELEKEASAIKEKVDSIRDRLKEELVLQNTESIDTGIYHVFWTGYEKKVVDSQKLKNAGLYEQYCKKQKINQFRITDVTVI